MIWLFKRILGLGVMVALVYFVAQYRIGNRQVKDYILEVYHSPLFQEAVRQSKLAVSKYLQKDVGREKSEEKAAPMDPVNEDEREELEKVLRESH